MLKYFATVLFFVMLACSIFAQEASRGSQLGRHLSTSTLVFNRDDRIPKIRLSPVLIVPIQCGASGTLFVQTLEPPTFRDRSYQAISPVNGLHVFSMAAVRDLFDVEVKSFFPGSSSVFFLISGTPDQRTSNRKLVSPDGIEHEEVGHAGTRFDYIVKFDGDGNYKGATQLNVNFTPTRLGVFRSGKFLLAGIDANGGSVFVLLNEDATALAYLNLKEKSDLASSKALQKSFGTEGDPNDPSLLHSMLQFYEVGSDLILLQQGSSKRPLRITEGGNVEILPIQPPSTLVFDSMVIADSGLALARVRQAEGDKHVLPQPELYEIDLRSGKFLRKFESKIPAPAIACGDGDSLLAIQRDSDGTLSVLRANLN